MLFFLLINIEMPTIVVGISTFMSRKISCSAELSMILVEAQILEQEKNSPAEPDKPDQRKKNYQLYTAHKKN